jgi:ubiquinone/menaquinone biosynthesis C-methylase UbiE
MLRYARKRAGDAVRAGRAAFVQADATDFDIPGSFELATSTFDALQLLTGIEAFAQLLRLYSPLGRGAA